MPHLHFQLMLSLLDFQDDFPGVVYPNQKNIWSGFCPDPNLLFKSKVLLHKEEITIDKIKSDRRSYLGRGMSLQY